jgi:hypothetical protein
MSFLDAVMLALAFVGLASIVLWGLRHFELVVRLRNQVPVHLRGKLPLRAAIEQQVDVRIHDDVAASVTLGALRIPLDETLTVPLDFVLAVPVDSEMTIDQPITLALDVPIQTVLTEQELDLNQLEVPIGDIFIEDYVNVEDVVHIETHVETTLGITVPVKADIPIKARFLIRQNVHVKDPLKLNLDKLQIPIRATIPVEATFPLRQTFRVRGMVEVPVKQSIAVPIHQVITAAVPGSLPVTVTLSQNVPAHLKASIEAEVAVEQAIAAELGEVRIGADQVQLVPRKRAPAPEGQA